MGKFKTGCLGLIGLVVVIGLIGSCAGGGSKDQTKAPTAQTTSSSSASTSSQKSSGAKEDAAAIKWNTSEVDATKNGNIQQAAKALKQTADLAAVAQDADASVVIQKPWEYYGKVLKVTGTVAVVDSYPPGSDMAKAIGAASEGATDVVISVGEDTIVEFFMQGSQNLKKGDQATLMGYPIGRTEVENKLGGKFTHLIMVGK